MYSLASDALSSLPPGLPGSPTDGEIIGALRESHLAHLRCACDWARRQNNAPADGGSETEEGSGGRAPSSSSSSADGEARTEEALRASESFESAQLAAMSLARRSGSLLHVRWAAQAAMLHLDACEDLAGMLKAEAGGREGGGGLDKVNMKLGMLPRLAESLMSRVVKRNDGDEQHPPCAEDWYLYLKALTAQGKHEEALGVLKAVECPPHSPPGDGGNDKNTDKDEVPSSSSCRINDESDIEAHEGSLIQLTLREKLERMCGLCLELGQYQEAEGVYRDLLNMFPDQWSYWTGLLKSAAEGREQLEGEGLARCEEMVRGVTSKENAGRTPMRGPQLFLVELAAAQISGVGASPDFGGPLSEAAPEKLSALSEAICMYGDTFAALASCCFFDLRAYIGLLIRASPREPMMGKGVQALLERCRTLRENSKSTSGEVLLEDKKERRKRLRAYIFSVQVTFEVLRLMLERCDGDNQREIVEEAFQSFMLCLNEMVSEWQKSLDLRSNPNEGGQKEVLPGDELILLGAQLVLHCVPSWPSQAQLIAAAALLESGISHSPFNPHLLLSAVGVYRKLNAGSRAMELYSELGVKQIQFESCSYTVLPALLDAGLYREAVHLSGEVVGLHFATAKDIADFASKACENGTLGKASEMVQWQRGRMRPSLQLLEAKCIIMDCAALVYPGELDGDGKNSPNQPAPLGAMHGLCGGEHDISRASKMACDAANFFAAPSAVGPAAFPDLTNLSDNRDLKVNQFEVLVQTTQESQRSIRDRSSTSALFHGLLMRAVFVLKAAKPPKKGKAAKVEPGEVLDRRCRSLLNAVRSGDGAFEGTGEGRDSLQVRAALWRSTAALARVICVVTTGLGGDDGDATLATLLERERMASALMLTSKTHIQTAQKILSQASSSGTHHQARMTCRLLPEAIVSLFAVFETTGCLLNAFGWGKRKRHTKAAAGALADVAVGLRDLAGDLRGEMKILQHEVKMEEETSETLNCEFLSSKEGREKIGDVVFRVAKSYKETRQRVEPFLAHITDAMRTYDVAAELLS